MKNSLETRLGVFFALTFIAAVLVLEIAGGMDFFKSTYRLKARFATAQELKKGDPVKMAGVEIGRVDDIHFADNEDKVEVVLKITRSVVVKTDSKATIKFAGLLGQNFVAVSLGTAKTALAADQLMLSAEQPELSAIMERLNNVAAGIENVTKSFSGDSIQNILGPFTSFMKDNQVRLGAIIANMQIVSQNLAEGKGTVGKILSDEALYNSVLKAVKTLDETGIEVKVALGDARAMIGDARKSIGKVEGIFDDAKATVLEAQATMKEAKVVVADINAGKGTIGKLMKDPVLFNETTLAMQNLREIFQKINQGQGSIGKFVNDDSLFKNAKMTLQKLDKATEGLEDTGPLSVLGTMAGSLF